MTTHVGLARATTRAALVAFTAAATFLFAFGGTADAAIVPTVPLATSAQYSALGGQSVTNTGPSTLGESLGVSPGSSLTGFPPGTVLGTVNQTNAAAAQAQSDLTTAYVNAAGRPINATTTANLGGLNLQGGVYAGPSKGALGLTGTLTLDGAGNPNSVFIFQTNSSLTTASSSTVSLINGAQECNVFWQIGSSATLGTGSTFVGNILALTTISLNDSVTVHGRALARNGSVTLINDTFDAPTCNLSSTPTTTAPAAGTTTGTTPGGASTTGATTGSGGAGTTGSELTAGPGVPGVSGPPRTGGAPLQSGHSRWLVLTFITLLGAGTAGAFWRSRHEQRGHLLDR